MTYFRYEWDKVEDVAKSRELGRPFYTDRVVCRFFKAGGDVVLPVNDAFKKTHFIPRDMRDNNDVMNAQLMEQTYEKFMAGENVSDSGMPIREWAAVSRAEAENLFVAGLTTLEKLAAATDAQIELVPAGKLLRDKAKGWLEDAKEKGVVANKAVALQDEVNQLKAENADLKKRVKELVEEIGKLETKGKKDK